MNVPARAVTTALSLRVGTTALSRRVFTMAFALVASSANAVAAPPAAAAPVAAPVSIAPASLRHLEYAVTADRDGKPQHALLALDLTAVTRDFGMDMHLAERPDGEAGAATADVHLDAKGALTVLGESGVDDEEEALLAVFSLSFENVAGVDKGDTWTRVVPIPGGTAETKYVVRAVKPHQMVELEVTHSATSDGYTSTWSGRVAYDATSMAPVTIDLNGESKLSLKLAGDSFVAPEDPPAKVKR